MLMYVRKNDTFHSYIGVDLVTYKNVYSFP